MDPKKIHFDSNNKKRNQNLIEDIEAWKFLTTLKDNDKDFSISLSKSNNYRIKYINDEKLNKNIKRPPFPKTSRQFFQDRVSTLGEKIWDMRSEEYNLKVRENLELNHIKHFAKLLLESPKEIQLEFCRQPTRQSMHQKNQLMMLEDQLNSKYWDVKHPKEGEIVIDGEDIVDLKKLKKKFSPNARSVDVVIKTKKPLNKLIFYGFMKFSKEQGTATTKHQLDEAKRWLEQAQVYSQANDDNINFFCISDGKEGERNIPILEKHVRYHSDRISVGNTDRIINILEKYEKEIQNN